MFLQQNATHTSVQGSIPVSGLRCIHFPSHGNTLLWWIVLLSGKHRQITSFCFSWVQLTTLWNIEPQWMLGSFCVGERNFVRVSKPKEAVDVFALWHQTCPPRAFLGLFKFKKRYIFWGKIAEALILEKNPSWVPVTGSGPLTESWIRLDSCIWRDNLLSGEKLVAQHRSSGMASN